MAREVKNLQYLDQIYMISCFIKMVESYGGKTNLFHIITGNHIVECRI
jgi:hypothetical protein